jgi:membrane-associated phospholipid phosphatase
VDWRLYHGIYSASLHHHWLGTLFSDVEKASIPFMVVVTAALWLLARPGGDRKWKLAAGSGFAAAAVALLVNLVIHTAYDRPRPYESHHIAHPWSSSTDASFPSDHASASLAIAFTILLFDLTAGSIFLAAAAVISIGRVFVGAHYPADVLAGLFVGLATAFFVARVGRPILTYVVRAVSRVTDPVVAPIWRLAAGPSED